METFSCNNCGLQFQSRNKLFKHIRECGKEDTEVKKVKGVEFNFESCPSNTSEEGPCVVMVLGGRLRGRTLSAVHCYSVDSQTWSTTIPMNQNRGSHGAACVNGVIYSIGGGGLHSNLDACEAFDGTSWTPIPALLSSRHALAVTSSHNKIFAVGGWVDGSKCSAAAEVYTPTETGVGTWEALPSLLHPRRLHGLAACGSQLFVFGGCCDDPHWYTDSVEVLSLGEDGRADGATWSELPSKVPFPGELCAVTVEPFIFLFLNGRSVVRYDPAEDTHTVISDLPVAEWHCFDAVHVGGGHIMVLGGTVSGAWTTTAFDYDVRTDTWTALPAMTQAKRRCACAAAHIPLPPPAPLSLASADKSVPSLPAPTGGSPES